MDGSLQSDLVVTQISATSDLWFTDHAGVVQRPNVERVIWSPDTLFTDDASGSMTPVYRLIPEQPTALYDAKITVQCSCKFPPEYPRSPTIQLLASSVDFATPILQSTFQTVSLPDSNVFNPITTLDLTFDSFTTPAPITNFRCPIPFRHYADLDWKIVLVSSVPLQEYDLHAEQPTRVEFCWMTALAPSRSNVATPEAPETGQDLQSIHSSYLCTLFLPHVREFVFEWDFGYRFDRWWAKHIVLRVQNLNLRFDMLCGKSSLGVGALGGNLDLDALVPLFARQDAFAVVNSFDVAALIQLGVGLLLDHAGREVLGSVWYCRSPFGLMSPFLPLGARFLTPTGIRWPPGVNNPYFWDGHHRAFAMPSLPLGYGPRWDLWVNNRSWIRVKFIDGAYGVLDAASEVQKTIFDIPEVDVGTVDCEDFLRARLEPFTAGDLDPPTSHLIYYENKGAADPLRESRTHVRMGVHGLGPVTESHPLAGRPVIAPIVDSLRSQIIRLICSYGENPSRPVFAYNDAPLKKQNLIHNLFSRNIQTSLGLDMPEDTSAHEIMHAWKTTFAIRKGVSKVSILLLPGMFADDIAIPTLNIYVHDSFQDTFERMVFELTKYERRLSDIVATPYIDANRSRVHMGHYALTTRRSVLYMRGNIFAEISINAYPRQSQPDLAPMVLFMQRLDQYLAPRMVERSQIRRPNMHFTQTDSPTGFDWNFAMDDPDTMAPKLFTSSSNSDKIFFTGPTSDAEPRTAGLHCRGRTVPSVEETSLLTITAAHCETFHPASISVQVTI